MISNKIPNKLHKTAQNIGSKITEKYKENIQYTKSLLNIGNSCGTYVFNTIQARDPPSSLDKYDSKFTKCTGKSGREIYEYVNFSLNKKFEGMSQVDVESFCKNFIRCLVQLHVMRHESYYRIFGLEVNNKNEFDRAKKYLVSCFYRGEAPDDKKFRQQWVSEQYKNAEFIIRMRKLAAGLDPEMLHKTHTKDLEKLASFWFLKLSKKVDSFQQEIIQRRRFDRCSVRILMLSPDQLAAFTLSSFFHNCTITKSKFTRDVYKMNHGRLSSEIGKRLCNEVNRAYPPDEFMKEMKRVLEKNLKVTDHQIRKRILNEKKLIDDLEENRIVWTEENQKEIGVRLLDLFKEVAYLWVKRKKRPAFEFMLKKSKSGFRVQKSIELSAEMVIHLHRGINFLFNLQNDPTDNPMLVKPKDWASATSGGFIFLNKMLVRAEKFRPQYTELLQSLPKKDLTPLLRCVNSLQVCAWAVNGKIYSVAEKYFNEGKEITGIPGKYERGTRKCGAIREIELDWAKMDKKKASEMIAERVLMMKKKRDEAQRFHNYLGLHAACLLKMKTAEKYLKEKFYFPYFLDFRGRCYPYSPYFNHNGDDLSRGLLKFSDKKPLTERGWDWLLVHLANLYGQSKISNAARKKWTEEHLGDVIKSATDPMGEKWWTESDSPWQVLACCFEIDAAIRSGNKFEYLSGLPVYQDGSCNGLQHYSAMGLDPLGGEFVNLMPSQVPKDAYTKVLNIVKQKIRLDFSCNDEDVCKMAKLLYPNLTRKIVKQTVMTTVYGVTMIGAREQIEKQLKKIESQLKSEFTTFRLSMYLAKKVMDSVDTLFLKANRMMDWLRNSARKIASVGQLVSWITPLNLPAMQTYGVNPDELGRRFFNDLDIQSQVLAFPPNFIHSLDSTHMLMTARRCAEIGICFASVHDSYWTHASDVDRMNVVLRDCFVDLHTTYQLENLYEQFSTRFPSIEFRHPPKRGNLDLNLVRKSKYFFS